LLGRKPCGDGDYPESAVVVAVEAVSVHRPAPGQPAGTIVHQPRPPTAASTAVGMRRVGAGRTRLLPTLPGFGPALYELIAGRYERRHTLITSNKSLTEWAAVVQDASLAAALVDRILHHGEVFFYLKGPSWRVKGRSVDGDLVPTAIASTNGAEATVDAQHRLGGPEDAVR
jgi:hypothetical protein